MLLLTIGIIAFVAAIATIYRLLMPKRQEFNLEEHIKAREVETARLIAEIHRQSHEAAARVQAARAAAVAAVGSAAVAAAERDHLNSGHHDFVTAQTETHEQADVEWGSSIALSDDEDDDHFSSSMHHSDTSTDYMTDPNYSFMAGNLFNQD